MAYVPLPIGRRYFYDDDGYPLVNGRIYTYKAGTTEPQFTFTDASGLYQNTNPILLDDAGSASIWVETTDVAYRFDVFDKDGNLIDTTDNIYSLKGEQGTPGGPKGDKGDPGIQGVPGATGPRGFTGPIGQTGPQGDSGIVEHIFRNAGEYSFTVPEGVSQIQYEIGGGGGGFWGITLGVEQPNLISSGTAGKTLSGNIAVSGGQTYTINIGEGGIVSPTSFQDASGKQSTISLNGSNIVSVQGGSPGALQSNSLYFMMSNAPMTFTTDWGQTITILPRAIFGESSKYGMGGNPYMNNDNPDATGNVSSGGTGEPSYNTSSGNLIYNSLGKGANGICIIRYVKD